MMPQSKFKKEIEKRQYTSDITQANIDPIQGMVDGYAIVFEQMTPIGDLFYEIIDRHALDEADLSDIKFFINHDDQMLPLARHRRGKRSTMDITIDEHGLKITSNLDIENNADSKKLCSAITRGDIEDMSFAFGVTVEGEQWDNMSDTMPLRRITKIGKVFEVSAVNDGAYPQTSISARSASLENEKNALANARAVALENEKRAENEKRQAALLLEKKKFLFLEERKHDTRRVNR